MSDDANNVNTKTQLVPAHATKAELIEAESDQVRDVGAALQQLQSVVKDADDLIFEYSEEKSGTKSATKLRFRAYKRAKNGST
jgi:hypothetical protein